MKRQHIILIITLAVLLGSLVTAGATARERDVQLRGYVDAAQSQDLPFWTPRLGVNAELSQYDPSELAQQLEWMKAANVTWVRQFFRWDEIEPQRGSFDWSVPDTIVEAFAGERDLHLVAVLVNTPAWAHALRPDATQTVPPDIPATFAEFAAAFAQRYGDTIDYYQIWDEPNLTAAWGSIEPRAAEYAALLSEAYAAIHGADAGASVIAAALAPTTEQGPRNISDVRYLRELYALGARDFTDAIAAKPYGFDSSPEDRTVNADVLNFSRIILLREIMLANDDATTPLWASHWGWNSLPDGWSGDPSIWGSVTAEQQQAYTLAALDRAEREWPWLGGMVLSDWQPDVPANDARWGFALIDSDDRPTLLYDALAARPAQTRAANGLYFATNPFTHFSGVWTFGDLGADIGWVRDSQLSFEFSGRDVSLLLRQDDYSAFLYATIDGQPANATPHDSGGNAIVNLTSNSREPELSMVPVGRGLPDGDHTLRIAADQGWDRWAFAGFGVGSGDLSAPYTSQIAVALFTAVVASLAAVVTALQIDWRPLTRPFRSVWQRLGEAGQLAASAVTSVALMIGMLLTWGDAIPALFRREPVQFGLAIVTAGLLYVEPGLLLALAASAILFVIVYHRVEYGLLLTVFYAPFFMFPVELYLFSFPMSELLILITAAAWLLRQLVEWGRTRQSAAGYPTPSLWERLARWHALDGGMLAWLALGILSLSWATYRGFAATELRMMIVEPVLFYLMLRSLPFSTQRTLRFVDTLVIAGVVVCLVGLFQFARGEAIITAEDGARRLASVYGSPNNVGLLLDRCIPFVLAFTLLPLDKRRRLLSLAALGLMGITLFLTQSVGAIFLGVPAGIAAVLLLVYGRRAFYALVGLAAAGGTGLFALAQVSARFSRVFDLSEGTSFFRLRLWQSTVQMLRDHPITGLGLDQFLYFYRGQYLMPDAWQEPNLSHPHNILLDWWVRLGIFGLLLLIALQAAFWATTLRLYRALRHGDRYLLAVVIGLMGAMAGLIAHGLIDNSVFVQDLSLIFALMLGLTASLSNSRAIDLKP